MSATRRRYTQEEIDVLRTRARTLMADLADVFDTIAEKVVAINEEMDGDDAAATFAQVETLGHEHRAATGRSETDHP